MAKLTDLGFSKNSIYETIVSTYNPDGSPNAAPMGVTMQDPQTVKLEIFNTSQTSRNLTTTKCAVINLTNDIDFFYKTAFKEANPRGQMPNGWFLKAQMVQAPKLQQSEAAIEVTVAKAEPTDAEKIQFTCKIEQITESKIYPQVYCRGMSAALEAIIYATRVKVFVKDKNKKARVPKLLQKIENCNEVINHTAPNSIYSVVMVDLMARIDSWRTKP